MRVLPIATVSTPVSRRTAVLSLAGLVIAAGDIPAARAGEICVACEGPAAAYRCEIEGAAASGEGDGGLQFLCIKDIAQRRGHASCAVARQGGSGCTGEPWRITREAAGTGTDAQSVVIPRLRTPPVEGPSPGAAPSRAAEPIVAAPDAARPKDVPRDSAPAATGGAAATGGRTTHYIPPRPSQAAGGAAPGGRSAEATAPSKPSSPSAMESAGDAIGGAAKKTWDCVTSLFNRC